MLRLIPRFLSPRRYIYRQSAQLSIPRRLIAFEVRARGRVVKERKAPKEKEKAAERLSRMHLDGPDSVKFTRSGSSRRGDYVSH